MNRSRLIFALTLLVATSFVSLSRSYAEIQWRAFTIDVGLNDCRKENPPETYEVNLAAVADMGKSCKVTIRLVGTALCAGGAIRAESSTLDKSDCPNPQKEFELEKQQATDAFSQIKTLDVASAPVEYDDLDFERQMHAMLIGESITYRDVMEREEQESAETPPDEPQPEEPAQKNDKMNLGKGTFLFEETGLSQSTFLKLYFTKDGLTQIEVHRKYLKVEKPLELTDEEKPILQEYVRRCNKDKVQIILIQPEQKPQTMILTK